MNAAYRPLFIISLFLGVASSSGKPQSRTETTTGLNTKSSGGGSVGPYVRSVPTEGATVMGPARPLPTVWLEPLDLTTQVGSSPLQVKIDNLGKPVGTGVLGAIAPALSLALGQR